MGLPAARRWVGVGWVSLLPGGGRAPSSPSPRQRDVRDSGAGAVAPLRQASHVGEGVRARALWGAYAGKWLVHVARTDGTTMTCAALPGPLDITCMYMDRTVLATDLSAGNWKATLTIQVMSALRALEAQLRSAAEACERWAVQASKAALHAKEQSVLVPAQARVCVTLREGTGR